MYVCVCVCVLSSFINNFRFFLSKLLLGLSNLLWFKCKQQFPD